MGLVYVLALALTPSPSVSHPYLTLTLTLAPCRYSAGVGLLAILLLPNTADAGGFLTGLGFQGWHWVVPLVIPFLSGGVAFAATGAAARRTLKELA